MARSVTQEDRWAAELESALNPSMGSTVEIRAACREVVSLARRYAEIQETWCCVDVDRCTRDRLEQEEAELERCISYAVESLPHVEGRECRARFQGDPRGYTVSIVLGDGRHDTIGGPEAGIRVPGS